MAASAIAGLQDLASWATPEEVQLATMLLECEQSHLFAAWAPGSEDKKRAFFAQVRSVEKNYPGGCRAYTANARELLRSSAAGENPFANMKPEVRGKGLARDIGALVFAAAAKPSLLSTQPSNSPPLCTAAAGWAGLRRCPRITTYRGAVLTCCS